MSPLDNKSTAEVMYNNLIGSNMGNMIFVNSVIRTLMRENTEVSTINTTHKFTPEEIDVMNEEYDCFVIPLANAFRASFISELKKITKLVKALRMPCVVIGVGLQTREDKIGCTSFSFNKDVKNFVNAVLEKSSSLGLRGGITSDYLSSLGYQEGKDHTVIGCPSLYMFGKELPVASPKGLTEQSPVSINYKPDLSKEFHEFLSTCRRQLPNYTYVPQSIDDLRLMYAGVPYPTEKHKWIPEDYPLDLSNKIYRDNKAIGFVNVPSWLEYMSTKDFTFGSRIHGNIAGILAGIPTYIFACDSRIIELSEYHNLPHMLSKNITTDTNIFDIYEKADFSSVHKGHQERFFHYMDFLKENQLETIYGENGEAVKIPFDEKLAQFALEKPITPLSALSSREKKQRRKMYFYTENNQEKSLKNTIKKIKISITGGL